MNGYIEIKGARIHNLKNIDVKIPKGKLTVITGVSGSGKSSLAFDTLFEEGRSRYLMFSGGSYGWGTGTEHSEHLRNVEKITGLSPTVAVEQRIIRQANPRSTVGTRTTIGRLLAMIFAAYGIRDPQYDDGEPLGLKMFQTNSPAGMCVRCLGSRKIKVIDEEKLYGDMSISVKDVAVIKKMENHTTNVRKRISDFYKRLGVSRDQTLESLTEEQFNALKYGSPKTIFTGANDNASWTVGEPYARVETCPKCKGTGLNLAASHTTIGGKNKAELEDMYIRELLAFLKADANLYSKQFIADLILLLEAMDDVGLYHLALSRPVPTLSGGETQRLLLGSYLLAEMDSIIFIFDEPTIGLHEVEKHRLINTIQKLVKRGNTVIAVEHDENFMKVADYIVDIGPHAGDFGGERIFQGTYDEFMSCLGSLTAPYLSGRASMIHKTEFKPIDHEKMLRLNHCTTHNLRDVSVSIPLGLMIGVAGVSGSGKSSLINDTLVPKLKETLTNKLISFEEDGDEEDNEDDSDVRSLTGIDINGTEHIKKCIVIDQKPIGRSKTSCPATYTGVFDKIRALFAKESGMEAGMFSTNSTGGCRHCKGDGVIKYYGAGYLDYLVCESCGGTGYIEEALTATLDGKNILDVLKMSVSSAIDFFREKDNSIVKMLQTMERVGMGYIGLGQKTPTISGGEAQRIKLATELGKSSSIKGNVYILDEPTTGLSFSDTERLLKLMQELVDNGATVIVTEHDPSVLSNCDYIIEMGPGGGADGGYLIAEGTPAELKSNDKSIIGRYLK